LKSIDGSIHVRRDARFVDDGDIITAAGLSAGMDMALHVVGRLAGSDRARQVREGIEYAPRPPHR
jgi:transcriptional regulator GlxA family with amidase domain